MTQDQINDLLSHADNETHRSGMWADTCLLIDELAATVASLVGERDGQRLRAEQAETRLDKDMSGFSSNGVYVCGSKESIDAVAKWCHEASTIPAFRQAIMQEHARAEAAEAIISWIETFDPRIVDDARAAIDRKGGG